MSIAIVNNFPGNIYTQKVGVTEVTAGNRGNKDLDLGFAFFVTAKLLLREGARNFMG